MSTFWNHSGSDAAAHGGAARDEDTDENDLAAPLLLFSSGSGGEESRPTRMARVTAASASASALSGGGIVYRFVAMRCLADRLPWIFHSVVTNGKMAALAVLVINLTLIALWIPFWLLGKMVTEYGVYALVLSTLCLVGRSVLRLIAFPGSSQKIMADLEAEFAKYAVQMITTACTCLIDLAHLLDQDTLPKSALQQQIPRLWRQTESYRDRVLGVFYEVLRYIYHPHEAATLSLALEVAVTEAVAVESNTTTQSQSQSHTPTAYGPGLTRYGNNRLEGDIGHFNSLTVRVLCMIL